MQEPDFARVYAEQSAYVRRILQRMGVRPEDLDDVVQDAFVTIYRLLPGFEGRSSMETWLYAVSWRVAAAYHRRARPRDAVRDVSATSWSIDGEVGALRMMALLEGVEPRDLDVFVLHEIGGMSISELSEMTGQARATLRRHVDRARATIQRGLELRGRTPDVAIAATPAAPPPSTAPVCRHLVTNENIVTQHHRTVMTRWRGRSTVEALTHIHVLIRQIVHETGGPVTFISVVEPHAPPPDREGRAVIRRAMADIGRHITACAFLAQGEGVFGLVPPVINACLFLSRASMNVRFFVDQHLALRWLEPHLTAGATRESLAANIIEMGRAIDEAEAKAATHAPRVATARPRNDDARSA